VRVALVQFAPRLGDVSENLDRHLRFIEIAKRKKSGLVVFPELSLTGYTLMDLVPEVAIDPARSRVLERLKSASRGIDIVLGFMMEKTKGIYHNAAAYLNRGEIVHLHRKVFLPTGGMFEEAKFFAKGRHFAAFDTRFGRAGIMVCRDFLSLASNYLLFADGAEFIIVISAAPGRGISEEPGFASTRMWRLMGEAVSTFCTAFVIYCNRVGFEDGKAFGGGSFVFSPAGRPLYQASEIEEETAFIDLDPGEIRAARTRWTFKREDEPEAILRSLARIVRDHED
jgi:predicted amidohydrolase